MMTYDLISRQAAIDALLHNQEVYANNFSNDPVDKYMIALIDNDAQTIAQLPSAQPERKTGKWIVVKRHEHYPSGKPYEQLQCPFCKRFDNNGDGSFCGYCGAEMR